MGAGADEESVELLANVELSQALGGVELVGAKVESLLLLRVGAGEDDNVVTTLGSELDSKVTKTANTQNTNASRGGNVVVVEASPDGSTTALEGSSLSVGQAVGDLEEESLAPDTGLSEGALVEVGVAELRVYQQPAQQQLSRSKHTMARSPQ